MTITDLDKELDDALAIEGEVVDNTVYLELQGEKFACRKVGLTWEMMKFAKAQRVAQLKAPHPAKDPEGLAHSCKACDDIRSKQQEAGTDAMIGLHSMIIKVLKPTERDRFNMFMDDAELEQNELESAIGDVIATFGGEADGTEGKELGKR